MSRKIQIEVNGCYDCPFQHFESGEGTNKGNAYYCWHAGVPYPDSLIASESDMNKARKKGLKSPLDGFPDWCPLTEGKPGIYSVEIPTEELR
jgi:hypothetical protein